MIKSSSGGHEFTSQHSHGSSWMSATAVLMDLTDIHAGKISMYINIRINKLSLDTSEIVVEGEIDVFTAGDYEIIYRVTDSEGQIETVHRLVTVATPVIGNQSPVINAQNRIVNKGDSFNPLEGVTAMDEEDGELTANIEVINNTVNVNEIGIYEVTYRVQDSNGATTIITVDVEVHDIPTTGFSLF